MSEGPPLTSIEVLREEHLIDDFDCGSRPLNTYLRRHALSNQLRGIGSCHVALGASGERVIAYAVLSAAQVEPRLLPGDLREGLPGYPTPCARLARLAVDRRHQGAGVGRLMLAYSVHKLLQASATLGIHAMAVDAKDERAAEYYASFGFVPLSGAPLTLLVPLATLRQAFDL